MVVKDMRGLMRVIIDKFAENFANMYGGYVDQQVNEYYRNPGPEEYAMEYLNLFDGNDELADSSTQSGQLMEDVIVNALADNFSEELISNLFEFNNVNVDDWLHTLLSDAEIAKAQEKYPNDSLIYIYDELLIDALALLIQHGIYDIARKCGISNDLEQSIADAAA